VAAIAHRSQEGNPLRKSVLLALPALGMAIIGSMLAVPSASADTEGCVARAEYRKVGKGDTKAKVNRIFDTAGHRESIAHSGRYHSEIRSYNTCSSFSAVSIAWDRTGSGPWRLSAKSAVWVH
jgi:hypothetical protein